MASLRDIAREVESSKKASDKRNEVSRRKATDSVKSLADFLGSDLDILQNAGYKIVRSGDSVYLCKENDTCAEVKSFSTSYFLGSTHHGEFGYDEDKVEDLYIGDNIESAAKVILSGEIYNSRNFSSFNYKLAYSRNIEREEIVSGWIVGVCLCVMVISIFYIFVYYFF